MNWPARLDDLLEVINETIKKKLAKWEEKSDGILYGN